MNDKQNTARLNDNGSLKLEFVGKPLSNLMPTSLRTEEDVPLWSWFPSPYVQVLNLKTEDQLINTGYQRLSKEPPYSDIHYLGSQLCHIALTADDNNNSQYWARSTDIEHIKRYPVILHFALDPAKQHGWMPSSDDHQEKRKTPLPMLQYLPVPTIGEYGVVCSNSNPEMTLYHISQLSDQAQTLWLNIGNALRDLAAPGDWYVHNDLTEFCINENIYQAMISPNFQMESAFREQLAETYQHVTDLQQSWQKEDWLSQWKEISHMAQELAKAYYQHAQQSVTNKPVPNIAHVFNMDVAEIYTASPFQAYPAAAIARRHEWQEELVEKETDLIISYGRRKPKGTTYVQIREEVKDKAREAVLANMWEQTKKLSDLDADVYLAMTAQMLKGIKDEEGNTWISAQQILNYRGIQPKTNRDEAGHTWVGGHRWKDIEDIADCIKRMENTWIKVQEQEIVDDDAPTKNKRQRPKKTISRESRLFMFGDVIYHNQLPLDGEPGRSIPIAWQYRQSSWMIPFLHGSNRFTGLLFQTVLNYDPYHEKWEKRLARHFMFWLRTNASYEKKPAIAIGDLIKELNLEVEEDRPQRTRDRFEKAMKRLTADGLLTWHYKEEYIPTPRKWFPTWLQQQIIVEDPPYLKNQYMSIESTAKAIRVEARITRQKQNKKGKSKNE